MVRVPTDVTAAQRAQWLAELSGALEEAQQLIWTLGPEKLRTINGLDLCARIEAAQAEARSLRLGRGNGPSAEAHPEWTKLPLWNIK